MSRRSIHRLPAYLVVVMLVLLSGPGTAAAGQATPNSGSGESKLYISQTARLTARIPGSW